MKSGMPWSLRGIDEETREAIFEAARRAGLSVSEWLNTNVSEEPERDGAATIGAAVDRLTRRLRTMNDAARAAVPGLAGRLEEIERHLERLHGQGTGAGSLKGISAMVEKLTRDIEDADERARKMIEGQRAGRPQAKGTRGITDAIRDLDQRISKMSERIPTPPAERAPPLDDVRQRLTALLAEQPEASTGNTATIDAALRTLEARIDEAKARLLTPHDSEPTTSRNAGEAELMSRIERRLNEIDARLGEREEPKPQAKASRPAKLDELTAAIAEISARQRSLDVSGERRTASREQTDIAAAIAALRSDVTALGEQVAALGRAGAHEQSATLEIARRIEALSDDYPLDRSAFDAIRADIEALRGAVEAKDGADRSRLDLLGEEIAALRGAFEANGAQGGTADLHQVESLCAAIADQLDELVRTSPDRTRLDALGEEVSALRRTLEADDSPRAIQRLEMRVAELGRGIDAALSGRGAGPGVDQAIKRMEERLEAVGEDIAARLGAPGAQAVSTDIQGIEQRLDTLSRSIVATLAERNSPIAPTVAQRFEERLDEISARIDDLLDRAPAVASIATMHARLQSLIESVEGLSASQREPAAALEEVKTEIAAIRRDIAARGPTDTANLEGQIRQLAERLDAAAEPNPDGPVLSELEAQITRLASQFEEDNSRETALHHVEESLQALQTNLSRNHHEFDRSRPRGGARRGQGTFRNRDLGDRLRPDPGAARGPCQPAGSGDRAAGAGVRDHRPHPDAGGRAAWPP